MAEAGLPGFDLGGFYALLLPAGTPKDVVHRLADATAKALASPELREKIIALGSEPESGTPEELLQLARDTATKIDRIIKGANIKLE